ncbi:monodechloroaminopyrrolnitrin synthase PrnB family protein [Saccharopolyspora spinosa]|uniref:Uncharacterized protein DUF1864 n=1 Tax=Saccharopolyspora spinosa TaxID=60894 RepID=A0A2N3Y4Z1_SACSN|nr:monodechloroaminopyrrolnitrin synthase PrnB family protein [Saccharopolyspora spinosa]PKW17974.1 uncharacterized protein DUF1864 [Saccharopolyspora spinosa]
MQVKTANSLRGFVDDEHIRHLDPLDFDIRLPSLWEANAAGDVRALLAILNDILPSLETTKAMSLPESVATIRDLGIVMGSVKRHGVEPVVAIPELEAPLRAIGERTGMIPRDTIHHYIRWNPTGRRERMYTGEPMEKLLMASVRISLPRLSAAVDVCTALHTAEAGDLDFALAANELAALVGAMEDSIDTVIADVTPEFFARTIRPYFEDIRIGEDTFLGPAAAHVPLALVDLLLWASDHSDSEYLKFVHESAIYGLEHWRPLYQEWGNAPSLAARVIGALERGPKGEVPLAMHASVEALCRTLRSLMVFRGKHLTVARKAYADEVRLYELGSGGGSIGLLTNITSLVKGMWHMLRGPAPRNTRSAT